MKVKSYPRRIDEELTKRIWEHARKNRLSFRRASLDFARLYDKNNRRVRNEIDF